MVDPKKQKQQSAGRGHRLISFESTEDAAAAGMDTEIPRSARRRELIRKLVPWLVGALILMIGVRWGLDLLRPSVRRERVRIETVDRGPVEATLTAAGTVQPASDQVISSPVEARLLRVLLQPGATVSVGDPLLELDVGQAVVEVDRLRSQVEQTESERVETQLTLEEQLIELRSQLRLRALDIEELAYEVEQDERLFTEGLISEAEYRATQVREKKALIERGKVEEAMANAEKANQTRIASLDARLRSLRGELAESSERAAMAVTRADRPGVLTFVVEEAGATIRPGDVLARIADPDRFRIEATISDVHAERLSSQQPVRVPLGARVLRGEVERVLPAIESGALRFWVELDDPADSGLRTNLRTDVYVVTGRAADVLRIAKGPFVNGSGRQRVFVLDDESTLRRRTVELGLSGYDYYEVKSGLEPGERVVVSDMSRYADLEQVRVK